MESEGSSAGVVGEQLFQFIVSPGMPCCMYRICFVSFAVNSSGIGKLGLGSLWTRSRGRGSVLDGFHHVSSKGGWSSRIGLGF
jgi:hypothetical protein